MCACACVCVRVFLAVCELQIEVVAIVPYASNSGFYKYARLSRIFLCVTFLLNLQLLSIFLYVLWSFVSSGFTFGIVVEV